MLIGFIVTQGCHFVMCLLNPRGCLTVAAMYDSVYTLSSEVGVVKICINLKAYPGFKRIVAGCFYNKRMHLKTSVYSMAQLLFSRKTKWYHYNSRLCFSLWTLQSFQEIGKQGYH